jgi:hypothetical protein
VTGEPSFCPGPVYPGGRPIHSCGVQTSRSSTGHVSLCLNCTLEELKDVKSLDALRRRVNDSIARTARKKWRVGS